MEILNVAGKEERGVKKTLSRTLLLMLVAAVLSFTMAAGVAYAATDVGGGKWRHGYGARSVFSNYYHPYRCHSSAADGRTVGIVRSGPYPRATWSKASDRRKANGTNRVYWNNRC